MNRNDNTAKSVNTLFLIVVLLLFIGELLVTFLNVKGVSLPTTISLIISEVIIAFPGLVFFVIKNKDEYVYRPFKKIKILSCLLLVIFTFLILPLVSAANIFSQLFTTNKVASVSGTLLQMPIWKLVFIIGIFGPFCEEFIFRGIIYNGLKMRSSRYIASAVISGLFFGLMHMNFNQFCYAFVMGLVFAFINECLDSIWPSFICHAVVNTENVVMMYYSDKILESMTGQGYTESYTSSLSEGKINQIILIVAFIVIAVVAMITTTLAMLLLYGICAIENKKDRFNMVFRPKKYAENISNSTSETSGNTSDENWNKDVGIDADCDEDGILEIPSSDDYIEGYIEKNNRKLLYPLGYLGIAFCLFLIFLLEPLVNLLYSTIK